MIAKLCDEFFEILSVSILLVPLEFIAHFSVAHRTTRADTTLEPVTSVTKKDYSDRFGGVGFLELVLEQSVWFARVTRVVVCFLEWLFA